MVNKQAARTDGRTARALLCMHARDQIEYEIKLIISWSGGGEFLITHIPLKQTYQVTDGDTQGMSVYSEWD